MFQLLEMCLSVEIADLYLRSIYKIKCTWHRLKLFQTCQNHVWLIRFDYHHGVFRFVKIVLMDEKKEL